MRESTYHNKALTGAQKRAFAQQQKEKRETWEAEANLIRLLPVVAERAFHGVVPLIPDSLLGTEGMTNEEKEFQRAAFMRDIKDNFTERREAAHERARVRGRRGEHEQCASEGGVTPRPHQLEVSHQARDDSEEEDYFYDMLVARELSEDELFYASQARLLASPNAAAEAVEISSLPRWYEPTSPRTRERNNAAASAQAAQARTRELEEHARQLEQGEFPYTADADPDETLSQLSHLTSEWSEVSHMEISIVKFEKTESVEAYTEREEAARVKTNTMLKAVKTHKLLEDASAVGDLLHPEASTENRAAARTIIATLAGVRYAEKKCWDTARTLQHAPQRARYFCVMMALRKLGEEQARKAKEAQERREQRAHKRLSQSVKTRARKGEEEEHARIGTARWVEEVAGSQLSVCDSWEDDGDTGTLYSARSLLTTPEPPGLRSHTPRDPRKTRWARELREQAETMQLQAEVLREEERRKQIQEEDRRQQLALDSARVPPRTTPRLDEVASRCLTIQLTLENTNH